MCSSEGHAEGTDVFAYYKTHTPDILQSIYYVMGCLLVDEVDNYK